MLKLTKNALTGIFFVKPYFFGFAGATGFAGAGAGFTGVTGFAGAGAGFGVGFPNAISSFLLTEQCS